MNQKVVAGTIVAILKQNNFEGFFVGGCVRDRLLGKEPKDFDVVTNATPEQIEKLFRHTNPVGRQFGIVRVLMDGQEVEVATFRKDSSTGDGRRPDSVEFTDAETDVQRRDFTINGLLEDISRIPGDRIIDFVGGLEDIKNKVLRFIGDPNQRIEEDKLRMLRFVRFMANLGFMSISEHIVAVKQNAPKIISVSKERITDEVTKMLLGNDPRAAIETMSVLGLLEHTLPEIDRLIDNPEDPIWHPNETTFSHTLDVVSSINRANDFLFSGDNEFINKNLKNLMWAALFHDSGKPDTISKEMKNGVERISNKGHEFVGEDIARKALKELKFSNDDIEIIAELVRNHMILRKIPEMRKHKQRKLLSSKNFDLQLVLCVADSAFIRPVDWVKKVLDVKMALEAEGELMPKPLITGEDLIREGFKPSKLFSVVLDQLFDMQLEKNLDKGTLLKRVKSLMSSAAVEAK